MTITNEVVAYHKYNEAKHVHIRYKYITDTKLTEGLTAAQLMAKVTSETLPAIDLLKTLKTRVCKSGDKYAVIASVRYTFA